MDEQLRTVLTGALIVIIPAFATFISYWIKLKAEQLKDDRNFRYIALAETAVTTAVAAVSQTYVDAMKETGDFDTDAQKQAFMIAKRKALLIMGDAAAETIKTIFGDLNIWVDSKIEQVVKQSK